MANKILVYSVTFYPHQGGMEKNSELLAQELNAFYTGNVQLVTKSLLNGATELNVNYPIIRIKTNAALIKAVINNNIVIVNGGVSLPVAIACFILRKPFVPIFQMAEIPGKAYNESKLKVFLKRMALLWSSKVVGVSQACLDSRLVSDDKGIVIYNPIDPFLEAFLKINIMIPIENRPIDILFAGRMIDGKGIFILLDALKILDEIGLKLNILFSGNGSEEEKFKVEVNRKKWNGINIKFQDFVRDEQLAQTYMDTKCIVLPSHTHTEGSPLSIAEALTFGCAVIHSDQPAMCEQTATAGISFTSGDSKALASAIKSLFEKNEWNRIMQRSVERSGLFSVQVYRDSLFKIMQEIMCR